jgi:hypothetical protein
LLRRDILTDNRKMLREKLEQMKNKFPNIHHRRNDGWEFSNRVSKNELDLE